MWKLLFLFFVCIELSYCKQQQQDSLPGINTLDFIKSLENMFHKPRETDKNRGFPLDIGAFPEVSTEAGTFVGQTNENSHAFYAIPFAEPPLGKLRFESFLNSKQYKFMCMF